MDLGRRIFGSDFQELEARALRICDGGETPERGLAAGVNHGAGGVGDRHGGHDDLCAVFRGGSGRRWRYAGKRSTPSPLRILRRALGTHSVLMASPMGRPSLVIIR